MKNLEFLFQNAKLSNKALLTVKSGEGQNEDIVVWELPDGTIITTGGNTTTNNGESIIPAGVIPGNIIGG